MAEPRKVFRIEHTAAAQLEEAVETAQAGLRHAEIMRELRALRDAITGVSRRQPDAAAAREGASVTRLTTELSLIVGAIKSGDANSDSPLAGGRRAAHGEASSAKAPRSQAPQSERPATAAPTSRIDHELAAVVTSTEQATQKILAAAEEIDSIANTLSAALDGRVEQGLAQDIQDSVIRIFEACNFQDLIGQRVAKVLTAVKFVEDHIARVLDEIKTATVAHALHGPRLDGDLGHASQGDVDAMFAIEP